MSKDKKTRTTQIFMAFLSAMVFLVIVLLIIISLSKVKIESHCEIDKISFNINETNNLEYLNLSDGKIDCSFKIEAPLWIVLISV